jgi:hypothetical protein
VSSALLGPADIRALAAELGIRPTKSLGQNFLHDANTIRRLVRTAALEPEDVVLEIGPGLGSLTLGLLEAGHSVTAVEIDPVLAAIWTYLTKVTPREIRSIPDVARDGSVDDLRVCQEARWLVGFWLNRGAAAPRRSPSRWMRDGIRPGSFWGTRVRETIASQVESIRHWEVYNRSYADCPAVGRATWFVDPPYEQAGTHYRFGSTKIDFAHLASWCRSRPGQVIVCENDGATWLPFQHLAEVKTTRAERRSKEVIWLDTFESRAERSRERR